MQNSSAKEAWLLTLRAGEERAGVTCPAPTCCCGAEWGLEGLCPPGLPTGLCPARHQANSSPQISGKMLALREAAPPTPLAGEKSRHRPYFTPLRCLGCSCASFRGWGLGLSASSSRSVTSVTTWLTEWQMVGKEGGTTCGKVSKPCLSLLPLNPSGTSLKMFC